MKKYKFMDKGKKDGKEEKLNLKKREILKSWGGGGGGNRRKAKNYYLVQIYQQSNMQS